MSTLAQKKTNYDRLHELDKEFRRTNKVEVTFVDGEIYKTPWDKPSEKVICKDHPFLLMTPVEKAMSARESQVLDYRMYSRGVLFFFDLSVFYPQHNHIY